MGPGNLADYVTLATNGVHRAGKPDNLGNSHIEGIPRFLAAVTCYLQVSQQTRTGRLCRGFSSLWLFWAARTAPFGAKSK